MRLVPRRSLALAAAASSLAALTLAVSANAGVTAPRGAASIPTYTNYTPTKLSGEDPAAAAMLGHDAGEPSIGVDHRTGKVMYQAVLQTIQATFDDRTVPAKVSWKDVTDPIEGIETLDPILFTDSVTGRTWVSQLMPPSRLRAQVASATTWEQ